MTSSVRPYRSALRTRQAEETRARIVAAAARLFAAQGYQATTISAIAKEAGVSAETVKTTAAKAELLIAAFEVTFSGSEAAETLADTEAGSGLTALPDDVFLDAVITQIGAANERGHALWTVLLGAALSDPVVDAALQRILANRAADYRGSRRNCSAGASSPPTATATPSPTCSRSCSRPRATSSSSCSPAGRRTATAPGCGVLCSPRPLRRRDDEVGEDIR